MDLLSRLQVVDFFSRLQVVVDRQLVVAVTVFGSLVLAETFGLAVLNSVDLVLAVGFVDSTESCLVLVLVPVASAASV